VVKKRKRGRITLILQGKAFFLRTVEGPRSQRRKSQNVQVAERPIIGILPISEFTPKGKEALIFDENEGGGTI